MATLEEVRVSNQYDTAEAGFKVSIHPRISKLYMLIYVKISRIYYL